MISGRQFLTLERTLPGVGEVILVLSLLGGGALVVLGMRNMKKCRAINDENVSLLERNRSILDREEQLLTRIERLVERFERSQDS
jgi:hypothetical protein